MKGPETASSSDDLIPLEREKALVEACRRGDLEAFEELVEAYQHRVYAVAFQMLHNRDEAEEAAQEVFVSCWRNLKRFRGDSRLGTWLYRIAVNRVKNRWKYHQRRLQSRHDSIDEPLAEGDPRTMEPADTGPGPRQIAEGHESMKRLHAAVADLPEEYREVVILRFFEDLQYEEIADVLGCSLGTVKSRINRARRRLREALEEA